MNSTLLLYLSCILAGFALIRVPLTGLLAPLNPLAYLVGVIVVLLFSSVLIYHGVLILFGKKSKF